MKMVVFIGLLLEKLLFPHAGTDGYTLKVWMDSDCPVCIYQTLHIRQLMAEYPNLRVEIYFPRNPKSSVSPFIKKYKLAGCHVFQDNNGVEAKAQGVKVVPEVRLFSSEKFLLYGGALNDACPTIGHCNTPRRNYVSEALKQHQREENIAIPFVNPIGCVLY